jgi:type I restriction enzyme R subunit
MKRYKAAQLAFEAAKQKATRRRPTARRQRWTPWSCSSGDMGAFVRLYTFLSQIFDYGNTAIEKRAIFYKRLIPLLEFGRERESIDLSKVKLTHHTLRSRGTAAMSLGVGEKPLLSPVTEAGSGSVQAKEKAYLRAIIEKLNTLFEGDLTDDDQLVYVNHVIMGKQFANSPDLRTELRNALMEALDAHTSMSSQALNSETVQAGILDILLNHARLWETLRDRAAG